MEKTVVHWLEQLEEPFKSQAISHTPEYRRLHITRSLPSAIIMGFIWRNTPEGWEYWNGIYHKAQREDFAKKQAPGV